jgi:hypothetical protein
MIISVTDNRYQYRQRLQQYADANPIKYLELLLYRKWREENKREYR